MIHELATLLLNHLNDKYPNSISKFKINHNYFGYDFNVISYDCGRPGDQYANHFMTVAPDTVYLFTPDDDRVQRVVKAADPDLLMHVERFADLYVNSERNVMKDESVIKKALANIKERRSELRRKNESEIRIEKMVKAVMEQGGNIQYDEARREVLKVLNEIASGGPVPPPDCMLNDHNSD